jgi:tetratricopeptide (TPR) repeat protein
VIAARLDRLGADAKRVLQVAAVLGRQFRRDQLAQLVDDEAIDVAHQLDVLERHGVVHRKHLFSTDEFRFGESLTQEVAYEGLLLKQRRQLHERVGALLETSAEAGPEHSALLAHHFARGDNREKATAALLRAARDAEQVPSYRTAARFYREAWELTDPSGRGAPAALERLALDAAVGLCRMAVIYGASEAGDHEQVARRARELAVALGDPDKEAALCTYQGMVMMTSRERFAEGLALVEEGVSIAQRAGLPLAPLARGAAWCYLLDGRFALAQRTMEWVTDEIERAGGAERLSDIYLGARYLRARTRCFSDDLAGALRDAADTHALALRAGNRTVQSGTAGVMAQVHFLRGDYAETKRWADRSLEIGQAIGNYGPITTAAALALAAAAELGEPTGAGRYLEAIAVETVAQNEVTLSGHLLVDALVAVGELRRAEALAQLAHRVASGRLREMLSTLALGQVLVRLGPQRWTDAGRCFDQALALGETLGAQTALTAARLGAGELALARGDVPLAARQLQAARALGAALGLGRYVARIDRLLAEAGAAGEPRFRSHA